MDDEQFRQLENEYELIDNADPVSHIRDVRGLAEDFMREDLGIADNHPSYDLLLASYINSICIMDLFQQVVEINTRVNEPELMDKILAFRKAEGELRQSPKRDNVNN